MNKFCVIGDSTNKPRYSSHIIVSSLNDAAKKLGLYDEGGIQVKWDALCQTHGDKVDVYISSYELAFPELLIKNSGNKPLLGVSSDNYKFILDGGKPAFLAGYFPLGVDSALWPIISKTEDLDRFSVLVYTESLARGGIDLCIESFGRAFPGQENCVLKIKDRNGTERFRRYIKERAAALDINIEYINEHWDINQIQSYLKGVDCQLYLNRSSTYALPPQELMTSGIPSIVIPYSGPKDYCEPNKNALCPRYKLRPVIEDLEMLMDSGARNFFLMDGYKNAPVWAVADIEDTANKLLTIRDNPGNINQSLSINARETANQFTWENSVLRLKEQLERWF